MATEGKTLLCTFHTALYRHHHAELDKGVRNIPTALFDAMKIKGEKVHRIGYPTNFRYISAILTDDACLFF